MYIRCINLRNDENISSHRALNSIDSGFILMSIIYSATSVPGEWISRKAYLRITFIKCCLQHCVDYTADEIPVPEVNISVVRTLWMKWFITDLFYWFFFKIIRKLKFQLLQIKLPKIYLRQLILWSFWSYRSLSVSVLKHFWFSNIRL